VAIKVADGQARSLACVTVAILEQLGLIGPESRSRLDRLARPVLRNVRGIVTGHIQPAVQLVPATPATPQASAAQ
jgi:L-asparaginase II